MKDLLQNESRMQDMIAEGKPKVRDGHTWKKRAELLAAWMEWGQADPN